VLEGRRVETISSGTGGLDMRSRFEATSSCMLTNVVS
jgi:hypothetical protein